MQKTKRSKITAITLIFTLVLVSICCVPSVNGASNVPTLSVQTDKSIYLKNVDASVLLSGTSANQTSNVTLNLFNSENVNVYSTSVESVDYAWSLNQAFGGLSADRYTVVANENGSVTKASFTYVNTEGWSSANFPLETVWKGITYTLTADRTLNCSKGNDWISFTFPTFEQFSGLTQTFTVNDMAFRTHLEKDGVIDADLAFVLAHNGLKFYLAGTQNIQRSFTVSIDSSQPLKKRLDAVVSGKLVFDFSDLTLSGASFSYGDGNLQIVADTEFFLDPTIFTDGFEDGTFDAWSSSVGDNMTITDVDPINGTYSAYWNKTVDLIETTMAYYYEGSVSSYNPIYYQVTVRIKDADLNAANNRYFGIGGFTEGSSRTIGWLTVYDKGTDGNDYDLCLWWRNGSDYINGYDTGYDMYINSTYIIELKRFTDGSNGGFQIWINGTSVWSIAGQDTDDYAHTKIVIGGSGNGVGDSYAYYYIDDVVCSDSYIGVGGADSTAPTYSSLSSSSSEAGATNNINATWTDETDLSGYIFSTNNTGTWVNGSFTSFSTNPETLSTQITNNATVGQVVGWVYYANDTSNNWNSTGTQTFTTTDGTAPTFGAITGNTTVAGAAVQYSCTVSDNVAVSGFIASWNNTGAWVNGTWTSGGSGTLDGTHNSTVGYVVSVKFYANDTSDNWGVSDQYNFTLTDGTNPTFGAITGNTTVAGAVVQYNCTVSDNVGVSGFIASWNNTGTWTNGTWTSGGAGVLVGTHNSTVGYVVSVKFYANDTSDNWAVSSQYDFTLTDGDSPTFSAVTSSGNVSGTSVTLNVTISDNVAVSHFIYSWNNTGTWVNGTTTAFSSNPCQLTGTWNNTVGNVVQVKVYSNDTSDNWGTSTTYSFTLTGYTLTLQARDMDGTNLPRAVSFTVVFPNGTSSAFTSNTAGLYALANVPYGVHNVTTSWGTHTVKASTSVTVIGTQTSNLDTKIARLNVDDDTKYLLMSLDGQTLPTPQLEGEANCLLQNVEADGSIEFKLDNANWRRTDEPSSFSVGESQHSQGDGTWSFSSNVLSVTDVYAGTQHIQIDWSAQTTSTDGYNIQPSPTTTEEEPTTTEPETEQEEQEQQEPIKVPSELVIGACVAVVAVIAYGELTHKKQDSPRKNYKRLNEKKHKTTKREKNKLWE